MSLIVIHKSRGLIDRGTIIESRSTGRQETPDHRSMFFQPVLIFSLQVITENEDTDLLSHPVTKRLLKIKWNMYGRAHAIRKLLVNMLFAAMVISAAIAISAAKEGSPSEKRIRIFKQILDVSICLLNVGFITKVRLSIPFNRVEKKTIRLLTKSLYRVEASINA